MGRVYSVQLGGDSYDLPADETFTPPAGFVWVIRDIEAYNWDNYAGTAVAKAGISVAVPTASTRSVPIFTVGFPFCMSLQPYQWRGHVVCQPEIGFTIFSEDIRWQIVVSGYQLELP